MQQFEIKDAPVLRDYQALGVEQIKQCWKTGHDKVVFLLPTGGGKTVVFCNMTSRTLATNLTKKVLILTHRKELFAQATKTLGKYGVIPQFLNDKVKDKDIPFASRCLVAMAETYERRLKKFPILANYDLVIVDECHVGNFKKIFNLWHELGRTKQKVVGCTATPVSTSKKDPLKNYYSEIVCPTTIEELIEMGSLVPAATYSAELINRGSIVTDAKNEDGFYEKSQMQQFDRKQVYDGLIDKFKSLCVKGERIPKTIVFNINKQHSKNVCQSFIDAGFRAVHVDSDSTDEERRDAFEGYEGDKYDILCNVNIATAGYDYPPTSVIVINRATKSVSFWLQACGRGSRPFEGKTKFIILDMASNWTELRLWQEERNWRELFFKNPRIVETEGAPAKLCKVCKCLNATSARVCIDCGTPFPIKAQAPPENPDFVEITEDISSGMTQERKKEVWDIIANKESVPLSTFDIQTLMDIAKVKGYKMGWVINTLCNRAKDWEDFYYQLQEFADWKGYHQAWTDRTAERYTSRFTVSLDAEVKD